MHIWADRYDRGLDDIFAVQEEVARTIVSTLVGRIQDASLQKSLRRPPASLAAYDCLLRGLAHFRGFAEDDNRKAYEMFERAVALDPQYALAHAYLVDASLALHGSAAAPPEVLDAAFATASHALELDPQESYCHRVLALIWLYRRDYDAAEHHYRRALELNPNDADRRMGLALPAGPAWEVRGSAGLDGGGDAPQPVPTGLVQCSTWRSRCIRLSATQRPRRRSSEYLLQATGRERVLQPVMANWAALPRPKHRRQRSCWRSQTSRLPSSFAETFCLNAPKTASFSARGSSRPDCRVSWLALREPHRRPRPKRPPDGDTPQLTEQHQAWSSQSREKGLVNLTVAKGHRYTGPTFSGIRMMGSREATLTDKGRNW